MPARWPSGGVVPDRFIKRRSSGRALTRSADAVSVFTESVQPIALQPPPLLFKLDAIGDDLLAVVGHDLDFVTFDERNQIGTGEAYQPWHLAAWAAW
jgi:hypothetical protein